MIKASLRVDFSTWDAFLLFSFDKLYVVPHHLLITERF